MKNLFGFKSLRTISVIFSFFYSVFSSGQNNFYDLNTIQNIEIFFSNPNWDYQMDTAKYGAGGYIIADSVKVNGTRYYYPGIKYKGNSSYDSTYKKNPLHIELDHLLNQSYQSVTDIKLSNGYGDPSMIREVLSFDILKNYMFCPRSNFARVYINGNYIGIYSNTENIGKDFCSSRFYSTSNNTFFKCNPIVTPTPLTKSNLKYINNDSSSYFNFYELKSTNGWNDLVKLCDSVTNFPSSIPKIIDLDRAIWMLAFNNTLINLDSYSGVFAQNYYLYKDNTGHFNPVIWDLNMSLGGFPFVGSGATSMGSLTVTNMQQLPANFHSTDVYWPLIKNILSNPQYKRMYIAHMRTIINEIFSSGNYLSSATQMQTLIDSSVVADTNKFFSYPQFLNAMSTNNTFGSYIVPGISNLMNGRINYLNSTSDFIAVPPTISNVLIDSALSTLNDSVLITASVSNAVNVHLGYRNSYNEKFIRISMFDDGLHGDGVSGDGIFGTKFNFNAPEAHYYIYAENSTAGIFSPERAEHEFYKVIGNIQTADSGKIALNEFLAVNVNGQQNEYLKNEDWIELYNKTNSPIDLYGLYLSDDAGNLTKFAFPINSVIPANSFLTVWADESAAGPNSIHCNFKLSSNGEHLFLSNVSGQILDSVSFGAQQTDVSIGRCPDGIGNFISFTNPSYNSTNCFVGMNELDEMISTIFPNPAQDKINITVKKQDRIEYIKIYDVWGKLVYSKFGLVGNDESINISNLPNGIYFLIVNGKINHKLIIQR